MGMRALSSALVVMMALIVSAHCSLVKRVSTNVTTLDGATLIEINKLPAVAIQLVTNAGIDTDIMEFDVKSLRYEAYNKFIMGQYSNRTVSALSNCIVCNHYNCDNDTVPANNTRLAKRLSLKCSAAHAITWHTCKSFIDWLYTHGNIVLQS
ncbi:hypothetical protein V1504DRAFT_80071 [Lipomyces starkeyi]